MTVHETAFSHFVTASLRRSGHWTTPPAVNAMWFGDRNKASMQHKWVVTTGAKAR